MKLLDRIIEWLYARALQKNLAVPRKTVAKNLDAIQTTLLLVDADQPRDTCRYLQAYLEDHQIKVSVLGITSKPKPKDQPSDPGLLYGNDFTFYHELKSGSTNALLTSPYDMLICLATTEHPRADLLCSTIRSPYKIALDRTYNRPVYDLLLQFETGNGAPHQTAVKIIQFLTQIQYETI